MCGSILNIQTVIFFRRALSLRKTMHCPLPPKKKNILTKIQLNHFKCIPLDSFDVEISKFRNDLFYHYSRSNLNLINGIYINCLNDIGVLL